MSGPSLVSLALRDLADDVSHYTIGFAHGLFDLASLIAIAITIYAAALDPSAPEALRPAADLQAGTSDLDGPALLIGPPSCAPSTQRTCISATVLAPLGT